MSAKQQDHHENRPRDKEKKKHFRDRSKDKRNAKEETDKYAPATPIILGKSSKSVTSHDQSQPTLLSSPSAKSFENQSYLETHSTTKFIEGLELIQETQKIFSDNNTDYSIIGIIGSISDSQINSKIFSVLQGNSWHASSGEEDSTFGITVSIMLVERLIILQFHEKLEVVSQASQENLLLGVFLFCICDIVLVTQNYCADFTLNKLLKEIQNSKQQLLSQLPSVNSKVSKAQLAFLFYDIPRDTSSTRQFPHSNQTTRRNLESALQGIFHPDLSHVFIFPTEGTEEVTCEDPFSEFRDRFLSLCAITRHQRNCLGLLTEREWFRNCSIIWEGIRNSIA